MKKKNSIRTKIENFYERWNIKYDEEKRIEDFKNRVALPPFLKLF